MTVIGVLWRAREPASGPLSAACVAVDKLSEAVMEETRALRAGGNLDLDRFTHAKNYGLLEVTRAIRAVPAGEAHPELIARLRLLRERLEENSRVLRLHFTAAEEIAELVAGTLAEAASDGTYSDSVLRGPSS